MLIATLCCGSTTVSELFDLIAVAEIRKPEFGDKCNNCGWCCLTEVCPTGLEFGKSSEIPCQYIVTKGDKHYCKLAIPNIAIMNEHLAVGTGCDAKTQTEVFTELGYNIDVDLQRQRDKIS